MVKGAAKMTAEILLVDDNPANLLATEAVLAPLGRPIHRAESGDAALKALLDKRFAVALLDVQMAGLDGFQTAELIRGCSNTSNMPIIFLTAYDSEFRQARRAYQLGAFDYLVKPFDAEILRHKVAAFVRLHEQEDQLRVASESARLRDVFIGVLGHDLRNPLGAIQMATALLERAGEIPERHRTTIARISRSAKRMQELIENVLDYTRGKLADGIAINPEAASLATICQHIVEETRTKNPGRQIAFEAQGNLDGRWDAGRLGQVISNLLGNAVQHCKRDPVRIFANGDAQNVTVSVRNPGCVPSGTVPRLFEPFQRGDDSSAGLGLGLYIVREIVRAHGGRVDVKADQEHDETEFIVELPRTVASSPSAATVDSSTSN